MTESEPYPVNTKDTSAGASPFSQPFREGSFEDYIVGENNLDCYSAALAFATPAGRTAHQSLYLFGEPGCGATHLMNAAATRIQALKPDARIIQISAKQFVYACSLCQQHGLTWKFRKSFLGADLVLLDDVQFLTCGKSALQTFNQLTAELLQKGKRLICTGNCPPEVLKRNGVNPGPDIRAGMVARVPYTDRATRAGIIRKALARIPDVQFPGDIHTLLLERDQSARKLVEMITHFAAFDRLLGDPISLKGLYRARASGGG